ncbi:MAG TPA: glycosyltransferase family 39 protein, partial [Thermoanaerobaculia bacterium]
MFAFDRGREMTDVEPIRRWRPGQVAVATPEGGFAARLLAAERAVGRFVVRRYALCAGLVMAVRALNVFVGLSANSVNDSDEARYGVSAYEMLQNRSYVVTTYGDQPEYWNLKPPLGYWLIALSYRLFGFSALAMRLPSVVCGLLTVLLTLAF